MPTQQVNSSWISGFLKLEPEVFILAVAIFVKMSLFPGMVGLLSTDNRYPSITVGDFINFSLFGH